jgi:hypothetical protein
LLVPGIYLALSWAFAIPVAVLEGTDLSGTINRSSILTKSDKGRIFVVAFLMLVLIWVTLAIVDVPLVMLGRLSHLHNPAITAGWDTISTSLGAFISTSLVGPLLKIALTLLYYDNRVRKEGFDLQLMMATLQPAAQTTPVVVP